MTALIQSLAEWTKVRNRIRAANKTLGFVPTMGALHAGHQSLLKHARQENDIVVLSIFVNPTQFNDPKDLERYPRNIDEDCKIAESEKVDFVILPQADEMYADDFRYQLSENHLSNILCGKSRPGHFTGVLTVVMKLLNLVQPDRAYFGEKDYQQYLLIKGMAAAFFMTTEIVPCPIIRDENGLALSSRNQLLTASDRNKANQFANLLSSLASLTEIRTELKKLAIEIDYLEEHLGRRFAAVKIGNVRLIDNVEIKM